MKEEQMFLEKPIKIIIGADIVPTQSNYHQFETGDIEELIGSDLKNTFGCRFYYF